MHDHKDLIVWQKSMDLTAGIYRLVKNLPPTETNGLSDQMRRASVSIASNIAEGYGRNSHRDFVWFLRIARGSCFELDTQIDICVRVGYFTEKDVAYPSMLLSEVVRMLNAMIKKIKDRHDVD